MEERNLRKVMVGTVTSNKMDKTVVVAVETSVSHKVYGKIGVKVWIYKGEVLPTKKTVEGGDK